MAGIIRYAQRCPLCEHGESHSLKGAMTGQDNNRNQIIGNLRLIWKEPLLLISILAIFYFLLVFVVYPIFLVLKTSFIVDKQFDISNYVAVFSKRYF